MPRTTSYSKMGCGCICALVLAAFSLLPHCDRDRYEIRVTGKEAVVRSYRDGEGRSHPISENMIYGFDLKTGEPRAFKNTWSLVEGKFRPQRLQALLEEGGRYRIETYGWDFEPLGQYENIISARKIND